MTTKYLQRITSIQIQKIVTVYQISKPKWKTRTMERSVFSNYTLIYQLFSEMAAK